MTKLLKLIIILTICFFGFETYRIFTHQHPMVKKTETQNQIQDLSSTPDKNSPQTSPSSQTDATEPLQEAEKSQQDLSVEDILNTPEKNPQESNSTKEIQHPQETNIHAKQSKIQESSKTPKLTIVFIADAAGKIFIDKASKYMKGGIHLLQSKGNRYENAFYPHANCSTGQGHACITTGTFPAYHGIVNNSWLDACGNTYFAEQDNQLDNSAVYDPENAGFYNIDIHSANVKKFYNAGVSPKNYKVDGIADQLIMQSNSNRNYKVFSITSIAETAVLLSGFLGKAIWMDPVTGLFTSSKYYYPQNLPHWVNAFNIANPVPESFTWTPAFKSKDPYNFLNSRDYSYSDPIPGHPERSTLFEKTIHSKNPNFGAYIFTNSPQGIEVFFNFVNSTIDAQLSEAPEENLVLLVNHAAFDCFAGTLGPQSQEVLDVLYHIDIGIGKVIDHAHQKVKPEDCLFVFLSDEGYYPSIPELLENEGLSIASRIIANHTKDLSLVSKLNDFLGGSFVQVIIPPFVYMNRETFSTLSCSDQKNTLQKVKYFLKTQNGIKDAWTFDELMQTSFDSLDMARYYKLHAFKNNPNIDPAQERRSGEIIFQTFPFTYVTSTLNDDSEPKFGVDHTSPYAYDSQTALYVYRPNHIEGKTIYSKVYMQQLPISLSALLKVPRPSGAPFEFEPLPETQND